MNNGTTKLWMLTLLLGSIHFFSLGQDQEKVRKLIIDRFEPQATVEITYNSNDFFVVPKEAKPVDELSITKIEELKDSLELTGDKTFLMRIGLLYNRMNRGKEAKEYLDKAIDRYKVDLEKDSKDKKLLDAIFLMYFSKGDVQNAIQMNESILNLYPDDTTAIGLRGFLHLAAGDYDAAISYSEEMIKKVPGIATLYFMRVISATYTDLINMQSEIAETGEWRSLNVDLTLLEEVKTTYASNTEIQFMALCSEFFVFFYDALIPVMQMSNIEPAGFKFPINKEALKKLDDFEDEFKSFLKMKEFKNHYTPYYSLGLVEVLRSNYKQSKVYFEKAIEARPMKYRSPRNHVVSAYDNLIASHMFNGDKDLAEEWQNKKVDDRAGVDPRAIDVEKLALFKLHKEELREGKKLLKRAIQINPNHWDAYAYLARVEILQGDLDKAEEYINRVYAESPDNKKMYNSLILLSLAKNDIDTVKFLNDRLLESDPENYFAEQVKKLLEDE